MGEPVDGMDEVGLAAERVSATRSNTDRTKGQAMAHPSGGTLLPPLHGTPTTDPSPSDWLSSLIATHGEQLRASSMWATVLATLAAGEVSAAWSSPGRLDPQSTLDAGTLRWLHLMDTETAASVSAAERGELCRRLLRDASQQPVRVQGLGEAGIVWIALERAVLAALDGLELRTTRAADFIVTLCRRFPLLADEFAKRHGGRASFILGDEYDVQDVLRALLRVHFDDVRPEEWNPSYGGVASRSDLLIKSERLVIETKMTRKNLGQRGRRGANRRQGAVPISPRLRDVGVLRL